MVDKNFFKKDLFKNLEKGDVFKFTSVGKFFTVFDITDDVVKYNTTFGRIRRYRTDSEPIDREMEVLIYPNRKREIRNN